MNPGTPDPNPGTDSKGPPTASTAPLNKRLFGVFSPRKESAGASGGEEAAGASTPRVNKSALEELNDAIGEITPQNNSDSETLQLLTQEFRLNMIITMITLLVALVSLLISVYGSNGEYMLSAIILAGILAAVVPAFVFYFAKIVRRPKRRGTQIGILALVYIPSILWLFMTVYVFTGHTIA